MNYRVTTEIPGNHVISINTWLISEPVHAFMPVGAWIERDGYDFRTKSICRFEDETDAMLFAITFGGKLE